MVKEKGYSQSRLRDYLQQKQEELEANTLKFSWHVVEKTPGYNTGGYYDVDVPAEIVRVSPNFDTEQEAHDWLDKHEPDRGKTLHVRRARLVRREWTEWVYY